MKTDTKFNSTKNLICTLVILTFSFGVSLTTDDIGDVTEIFGPTTNSAIGFFFPIIFYFKFNDVYKSILPKAVEEDEEEISLFKV